jgi:hypothetical protein
LPGQADASVLGVCPGPSGRALGEQASVGLGGHHLVTDTELAFAEALEAGELSSAHPNSLSDEVEAYPGGVAAVDHWGVDAPLESAERPGERDGRCESRGICVG